MKNASVRKLAFTGLIAAVYAALTMALGFMSYGNIQFRIAEALCILPFFFPYTTWGLFIGCLIANLMSPSGLLDIVFGSLATLLSCLSIAVIGAAGRKRSWGRCIAACLMPVIFNAVIVGAVITLSTFSEYGALGAMVMVSVFGVYALEVGAGELAVMFIIGLPLMRLLPEKAFFGRLSEKLT